MALAQDVEPRVLLEGVSWSTYQSLLADYLDRHTAHFNYDRGRLEIVVLSFEHERINRLLSKIFQTLAEELELDHENAGSTTFGREDLERGFESDTCFYVGAAAAVVRGRSRLSLETDPAPDLVVEVDVSRGSMDKLAIYSSLRVPEVWRYTKGAAEILCLEGSGYVAHRSRALPGLGAEDLTRLQKLADTQPTRLEWVRELRRFARSSLLP